MDSQVSSTVGFQLATAVLQLAISWKLFLKYGKKWWQGIIPFYGDIVEYSVVWKAYYGIIYVVLTVGNYIFSYLANSTFTVILSTLITLGLLVLSIIFNIKKCRDFGKSMWYVALLIVVPLLGNVILAFGKAEFKKIDEPIKWTFWKKRKK